MESKSSKATVYMTKNITPEGLTAVYNALERKCSGKTAVKLSTGEPPSSNYLRPALIKDLVQLVHGTIVECNTAYEGARDTTEKHQELMTNHGWTKYFSVDIMDGEGEDKILEIPNGKVIKKNYVGKNIDNYDSMLVLSHFKGHPMGGYGGALKQLSIGIASGKGKRYIHCIGKENGTFEDMFQVDQIKFLEAMADSASSITKKFEGRIAYINVMCNMSVDCDCCEVAEDPCMKDIGILASLDPVAIDQACIDLIKNSDDEGKGHLLERINSRHGTHTIDASAELGIGTKEYELIEL